MLFSAEISEFKIIHNVLKAITIKEFAVFRPMEQGLKVTIEEMACVQTSTYIPCEMFSSYHIDNSVDDVKFKISLKVFTECLNIYGDDSNPHLKLSYQSYGAPLSLMYGIKHSEEFVVVDCEISTMEIDDFFELSLAEECNLNKVAISAVPFLDALQVLDIMSDEMELILSPDVPHFQITAKGVYGNSKMETSKDLEMVLSFDCPVVTQFSYTSSYIRQIFKGMSYANKVSLLTGESGLLGLQLFINHDDKEMYVEYYVTANV